MTLADLYSLGVVHWLTDGMTNITLSCLPNRLTHCVWNFFRARLIHRLADRVALLTGLVHRLANRIRNLFCPRLIHRLADRVALLTGLIHRLANCIRNLFCPRLIHRLADCIRNLSCTRLEHRLADRIFHFPKALLLFIANAVYFLLLYNFFADGFVAGVLLLFVDNILDKPRTTT